MFARFNKPFPPSANIKRHQEMEILIAERGEGQRREAGLFDGDPQFFVQFPDQALFGAFARFHFAARKFPEPRHAFAFRPFSNQNTAVRINKRTGNNEKQFQDNDLSAKDMSGAL